MSDTKLLPRRATDPLKIDHRLFAQMFKDFAKLDEWSVEQKIEMFRTLADRLAVHAAIEEQLFYPALQRNVPAEDRPPIFEAREEHRIVKRLLAELAELGPEDEQFDAKMTVLGEMVNHHAKEEERELFPLFNALPDQDRDPLIRRLADREEEWGVGQQP
jgi:iron-sulfur cluster repair protein YtfE (RIC family)